MEEQIEGFREMKKKDIKGQHSGNRSAGAREKNGEQEKTKDIKEANSPQK